MLNGIIDVFDMPQLFLYYKHEPEEQAGIEQTERIASQAINSIVQ